MGIITNVTDSYDQQAKKHRIFVRTRFSINNRSSLNRVAGRVSIETGVGQRTLVASAYDELDISLVWNEGPGRILPERKFPEAKKIKFSKRHITEASNILDILPGYLRDYVKYEQYEQPGEFEPTTEMLYMWEIPYSVETYMKGNPK